MELKRKCFVLNQKQNAIRIISALLFTIFCSCSSAGHIGEIMYNEIQDFSEMPPLRPCEITTESSDFRGQDNQAVTLQLSSPIDNKIIYLAIPESCSKVKCKQGGFRQNKEDYDISMIGPSFRLHLRSSKSANPSDPHMFLLDEMFKGESKQANRRKNVLVKSLVNGGIDGQKAESMVNASMQKLLRNTNEEILLKVLQSDQEDLKNIKDPAEATDLALLLIIRTQLYAKKSIQKISFNGNNYYLALVVKIPEKRSYLIRNYDSEGNQCWVATLQFYDPGKELDQDILFFKEVFLGPLYEQIADQEVMNKKKDVLDAWRETAEEVYYFTDILEFKDLSKDGALVSEGRFYPETTDVQAIYDDLRKQEIKLWTKVYFAQGKIRVIEQYVGPEVFDVYLIHYDEQGKYLKAELAN